MATVARVVTNSASVAELADDWLTAKRVLESAAQAEKSHSDRARRADLERWAVVLGEARGRSPTGDGPPIASLVLGDLSEEVLLGAMAAAKRRWSDATVARMPSKLRGFTYWLHRTGRKTRRVERLCAASASLPACSKTSRRRGLSGSDVRGKPETGTPLGCIRVRPRPALGQCAASGLGVVRA